MTANFSFANGEQADYVEALYKAWKKDATSVDHSWAKFFEGFDFGRGAGSALIDEQGQTIVKLKHI